VIDHYAFATDPWCVRETELDFDVLAQAESVFALSNGHLGLRGNLDEGEPHGIPGTYLNSVYEVRPLPYAEAGFGYPEAGQSIINVTNGKLIRLLVNDEPFDTRYGTVDSHERCLDLRAGTLTRVTDWTSPAGCRVRVTSVRLVSLTQRAVAAISYQVEPLGDPLRFVVQSELVANEAVPDLGKDPRVAAAIESPLAVEDFRIDANGAVMVHRTRHSDLGVAAAMTHELEGPEGTAAAVEGSGDVARYTVTSRPKPGEKLRFVKYLAYGWSAERSRSALHDQVVAALAGARSTTWDGLLAEQREFLDDFWSGADVEVVGDIEVQQAVRFALFHIVQSGARSEQRMIPAKGLTGPGYDGHTFWDTEMFVLPTLIHTYPRAAADELRWRHSTAELARDRAVQLGLRGTAFPWRTIHGEECSSYWPAGTAAFHVNADIAYAVNRYLDANPDETFERDVAIELLVDTARLFMSLGHHDAAGRFRIDGVTGPDEYSAVADNNVFTNLMARRNLIAAADIVVRHPERAERLHVTNEETASWRDAAAAVVIPYDDALGVHMQSEEFTEHAVWDFDSTKPDQYPLFLHFPYYDLYRKQVVKQADLVLAMHVCPEHFTADQKRRNFAYYEALTVRDSSLSASTQSVVAAEVGELDLAYAYLRESALIDLRDRQHNTRDGLHLASLAGAWSALVEGFGGMRTAGGRLSFDPHLPPSTTRFTFRLRWRGRRLAVDVETGRVTYRLVEGEPLRVRHGDEEFLLESEVTHVPSPIANPPFRPTQPKGRAPFVGSEG
jgi:alpha,alpha-trehalose phosphorylase